MSAALIALIVVTVFAVASEAWLIRLLWGGRVEDPTGWVDKVLRKRIIVHTNNNQSIEGSLVETMEDGFVLRAAQLLNDEGNATSMAGEVFIPRGNVAFAQLDE